MKIKNYVIICAAAVFAALICIFAFSCRKGKIEVNFEYYFVVYRTADNSFSASSFSDAAASFGGAGYVLEYNDNYYITIACYYSESDAEKVCESLKKRDLDCSVQNITIDKKELKNSDARKNAELYRGNLETLNSLSAIAYECANGLDSGEYNQSKAKDLTANILSGLCELLKANEYNCFESGLDYLVAECENRRGGYIYSKDMRYLQIAILDVIINSELE